MCSYGNNILINNASDYGGVITDHIGDIGGFGGMGVTMLQPGFSMQSDGTLSNGNKVMVTYSAGSATAQHAVVAEGWSYDGDGNIVISIYDPTTGERGALLSTAANGYYSVSGTGIGS